MADEYVLDTFAVVAFLRRQPGAPIVQDLLRRAARSEAICRLSAMSVGETAYIVERESGIEGVRRMLAELRRLSVTIEDATRERILAAAHVKAHHPVSYADAFAVALAEEFSATIVTGDPEFRAVESMVSVEWLPRS